MHSRLEGAARLTLWVGLYLVAGVLGRLTIDPVTTVALVWPAAGVAVLWLVTSDRHRLLPDLAALGATTFVVTAATATPVPLALLFAAVNCVQPLVFIGVLALGAPELLHRRGPGSLRDYALVLAAAMATGIVGATLGEVGLDLLAQEGGAQTWLSWWGRNTAGIVTVVAVGLLLLRRDAPSGWVWHRARAASPRRLAELVGVLVCTAVLVALVFGVEEPLPIGFLLLPSTVLVAVRFSPLVSSAHSLLLGVATLSLTLDGVGPFAQVLDPVQNALLAQVFVMVTAVTGAVVAFSRAEIARAHAALGALHAETQDRAQLFGAVLENMHEGVAVLDAEGGFLLRNAAGRILTDGNLEAPLGPRPAGSDYGLSHLDGTAIAPAELPHARAVAGESVSGDFLFRPSQGAETLVLEVSAAPLAVNDRPAAIVSFRDVTALRHDRDALAAFAGVVAHDLKRPLAVIHGWSSALVDELARGPVHSDDGMPMLDRVVRAADQMGGLIDSLLHYTVVRDAQVQRVVVDVSATAREAAAVFGERSSRPTIVVQGGIEAVGDPVMLRQVIDNLLGNAVKYVAPDVRPVVRLTGRLEDGWCVVQIADNGIGIPVEHRGRVFETFHRVHRGDYRGTGLGLAIVQRALERTGGSVSIHDNAGGGTVFEVRLPAVLTRPAGGTVRSTCEVDPREAA